MGNSRNSFVYAIFKGPKEPSLGLLRGMMSVIVPDLQRFAGEGFSVRPHTWQTDAQGTIVAQEPIVHKGFISGVYADSPFRAMLAEWLAKAAYLGCGFCLFNGQHVEGAMRWGGYAAAQPQVVGPNAPDDPEEEAPLMFFNDPRCRLCHEKMVERGQQVEDGDVHPSDAGCNGYCPLVAGLPYLDYKFMWRLPLAHACLSGVLADFFDVIIEYGKAKEDERPWFGLPLEARRLIEAAADEITATADMPCGYRDLLRRRGHYKMDEWLVFLDTYSTYIFVRLEEAGLLDERLKKLWGHLRRALIHFLRDIIPDGVTGAGDSQSASARAAARDDALAYAKLVEEDPETPLNMLKPNLHWLQHAAEWEQQTGALATMLEFWVERLVGVLKRVVKYRTTEHPEKVMLKSYLLDRALAKEKAAHPQVKAYAELFPAVAAVREGEEMDAAGGAGGSSQLLGPGRSPCPGERQLILDRVRDYLRANRTPGFTLRGLDGCSVWVHSYADVRGREIVTSEAYTRSTSRDSSFVRVRFAGEPFPGVVRYYVRVVKAGEHPLSLRLAVCRFYAADPARPHVCDPDLGVCLRALEGVWADSPPEQLVSLDAIDCKLNRGRKPAPRESGQPARLYFFPAHIVSKSRLR